MGDPADDRPDYASLSRQLSVGGGVCLPYFQRQIQISTPFESSKITASDPFIYNSTPFTPSSLEANAFILDVPSRPGGTGTFTSAVTTRASARSEHFSMSGGISIGNSFLGASGSGKYDKAVAENKASCKSSQRASYRLGIVRCAGSPVFSDQALAILEKPNGQELFRQAYGDYYVDGLVLGADCGVLLSTAMASGMSSESLSVVIEAHFLCFSASYNYNDSRFSSFSTESNAVQCFDTLSGRNESVGGDPGAVAGKAAEYAKKTGALTSRFEEQLARTVYGREQVLNRRAVEEFCRRNLVAEILIEPYTRLRQYFAMVN